MIAPLPTIPGGWACIVLDPPLRFTVRSPKGEGRSPCRHYNDMSIGEIASLRISEIAAQDCHLFYWPTGPHLHQGREMMESWQFHYSGIAFTWLKLRRNADLDELIPIRRIEDRLHLGLGFTTRKNSEICLLGRRGSPKRLAKNIREIIIAPVREHSRKPDEFYSRVARYSAGPRVDLFARETHDGFVSWGDEVKKFQGLPTASVSTRRRHVDLDCGDEPAIGHLTR